jgi:hypothetical protein
MKLVPISEEALLRENGIFFKPATLRQWHSTGKNAHLFRKVSGRVFIDLREWKRFEGASTAERAVKRVLKRAK